MSDYGWQFTPDQFRALWPEFDDPSWAGWASIEDVMFGLEPDDPELVEKVTGRSVFPVEPVSEFWAAVGRGGGKSRFCGRLAVYFACGRSYRRVPGERIFVGIFAPDRKQAAVTFRYIKGLIKAVPQLERMVTRDAHDSLDLDNGVTIEVITASKAAPRGRSYALAIVEEAAFLPADDAAEPDTELLRAVRPALARVPNSMLAVVSSPYARQGALYRAHRDYFGRDDSNHVLVIQADTLTLNPAFSQKEIERAYREDPESASAEYGAEFRKDIAGFVTRDVIEACTAHGRHELPPVPGERYFGFLDFAGGSGSDSATLAIAHAEKRDGRFVGVLDVVREVNPPFSPEAVCKQFAEDLRCYSLTRATADRYAADFAVEAMGRHDVTLRPAGKAKSDIYRELLPAVNSGAVELLDQRKLRKQLAGLERRVARGGRDSIDHGPGGHDDVINAAAGALVMAIDKKSHRRHGLLFENGYRPIRVMADMDAEIDRLERKLGVAE